ncbi:Ubiquitin 3 binding protein But2 C-terminal domain-containing protein [Pleurotus pulmonarius]
MRSDVRWCNEVQWFSLSRSLSMEVLMSSYKLLPVSPESPTLNDDDGLSPPKQSTLTPRICLLACILCTIFNLVLSFRFEATLKSNAYPPVTYKDIQSLRRPSQFIRFDEITRASPPVHKEFNNYPILMTQVDSAQKDKVFEDDVKRYMTPIGTISPRDRRVLVTDMVSTVAQFRAIDYGMERCELYLALPSLDPTLLAGNKTMALADEQEVLSFELACSLETTTEGCHIEWWQSMKKPNPGLYIIQHSTV